MTDTFANGPGASDDAPSNATQQAGDLTGTLAELERKLRELEGELSSIGRRRLEPSTGADTTGMTGGRLVDEAIEPPTPTGSGATSAPPVSPLPTSPHATVAQHEAGGGQPMKFLRPSDGGRQPQPSLLQSQPPQPQPSQPQPQPLQPQPQPSQPQPRQSQPLPPQRSQAQPHQAQGVAQGERLQPNEAQLASLAELRRFRDRLERFARDLADEYDALLGRVMSGLTSTAAPEGLGVATPAAAAEPLAAGDPPQAAIAGDPQPAAAASPEDTLFEGRVELGVGPFYDIASLTAFERQLANLAFVVEASVRRFEASHAVVDVRLSSPVALVRELRRAVAGDFSVREIADGRVLLTFDEA